MSSIAASSGIQGQALRTFWNATSVATSAQDVIAKHATAGQTDRNMRWNVRRDWRDSGLVSNLFPVKIDPNRIIFRYELEVTRLPYSPPQQQQHQQTSPSSIDPQQQHHQQPLSLPPPPPVSPTRAWRMYAQSLRQVPNLPPVLRVGSSIFSAGPLPEQALSLSENQLDLNWESASLRLVDHAPLSRLSPSDLKQVMNKMLPWALSFHARHDGSFAVVREVDGKMISTEDSIAVSGLRIFRGTTASMLQISNANTSSIGLDMSSSAASSSAGLIVNNNNSNNNENSLLRNLPSSSTLATLGGATTTAAAAAAAVPPLLVLISAHIRKFEVKGRQVNVYQIRDSSGISTLTLWDFDRSNSDEELAQQQQQQFSPGLVVELSKYIVRPSNPRFRRENELEFEVHGSAEMIIRKAPSSINQQQDAADSTPVIEMPSSASAQQQQAASSSIAPTFHDATTLALRLDTRCTVASEKSLLDEIKQHFGNTWPYDEEQKKRITRAVQGTPCILSTNLRHTIVRAVKFDFDSPENAQMDPHLRKLAPDLQKCQPFAVVHDYSIVPLQVLHCCFDPKMRSWQQVTAPACSFFPNDRVQVLGKFRSALADGLSQWGVTLLEQAFSSREVTVMEKPEGKPKTKMPFNNNNNNNTNFRTNNASRQQQQFQQNRPRAIAICSIRTKHSSPEELQANEKSCVSLARHFATPHHAVVDGEAAALQHVRRALCIENPSINNNNNNNSNTNSNSNSNPSQLSSTLRDPNSVAIFLSTDRDSRAARWLTAECLRRGIMPYFMSGISNEKKLRLLNVQTSKNIQVKFNSNPFPSNLDLSEEVPSMRGKNVLLVGVDVCHNNSASVGSCVGFVVTPGNQHNFCIPTFWQNEIRGSELEQVTRHFGVVVEEARRKVPDQRLDEVVVFQDGSVFAELDSMERCIPAGTRLSFMCLHKRTHIRFTFKDNNTSRHANVLKGSVVRALTPVNTSASASSLSNDPSSTSPFSNTQGVVSGFSDESTMMNNTNDHQHQQQQSQAPNSFFLQNHECQSSTARTVQFVVHRQSDTLPLPDLQKLTFSLAHVGSPQSTKLPVPTRAAHRLSAQIERLIDASPAFKNVVIPAPLRNRCWFL